MKKVWALLLLLCVAAPASASDLTEDFVTGKDWVHHMSKREKYISLIPPTLLFADYDVELKLSLPHYISLIDQVMDRNPQLETEEVTNIFASTIFLFEPQNRAALRQMELDFLRGDAEPVTTPRLSIEELLAETAG